MLKSKRFWAIAAAVIGVAGSVATGEITLLQGIYAAVAAISSLSISDSIRPLGTK